MKKYLLTIIISLLVGFLLSNYMVKQYDKEITLPTFGNSETVYLIQQGVYSSMDSMQENTKGVPYYIYTLNDNYYYVYIGLTMSLDNVIKIQKYYKDLNIETIVKNMNSSNREFLTSLKTYDELLSKTEDKDTIKEVIKQGLSKYQNKENISNL